jgi:hypothetical protein
MIITSVRYDFSESSIKCSFDKYTLEYLNQTKPEVLMEELTFTLRKYKVKVWDALTTLSEMKAELVNFYIEVATKEERLGCFGIDTRKAKIFICGNVNARFNIVTYNCNKIPCIQENIR